jgi:hypothetical protein
VTSLPTEVQTKYFKATGDPWFTNAELWPHLKDVRYLSAAKETIILQAHINQQCYADLTNAGQTAHDRSSLSLISFNFELKRRRPLGMEIENTLVPPDNLSDLLKSAPLQLYSPGLGMFEQLSVEDIVTIRRHAGPLFGLAHRRVETVEELEKLRRDYLNELEKYWNFIVDRFEKEHTDKMIRLTRVGLFVEGELGKLGPFYNKYGTDVFSLVLRFLVPVVSPFVSPVLKGLNHIGFTFLHERTPENERLRSQLPPLEWNPSGDARLRGLLSLEGTSAKADSEKPDAG